MAFGKSEPAAPVANLHWRKEFRVEYYSRQFVDAMARRGKRERPAYRRTVAA